MSCFKLSTLFTCICRCRCYTYTDRENKIVYALRSVNRFINNLIKINIMTKKDYILIASVLKESKSFPIEIRETNKKIITINDLISEKMADVLQKENPRFNREKFLTACGLNN